MYLGSYMFACKIKYLTMSKLIMIFSLHLLFGCVQTAFLE